jgi:hypothetical protein
MLLAAGWALGQVKIPVKSIEDGEPLATKIARGLRDDRADALSRAMEMQERGAAYLLSKQDQSGGWGIRPSAPVFPAVTGLVVTGLISDSRPTTLAQIQKALDFVLSHQQADGGIYDKTLPSYNTAICVSMLSRFPDAKAKSAIEKALPFLKGLQFGEGAIEMAQLGPESAKPVAQSHPFYGGVGYGRSGRPDLSNTAFWLEALSNAGVETSDPAFARALVFLQRVQQVESFDGMKISDMPYAKGSTQGGFIYSTSVGKDQIGVGQSYGGELAESLSGPPGLVARVTLNADQGKPRLMAKEAVQQRIANAISASKHAKVKEIGNDVQVLMGPGESSGSNSFEVRAKITDDEAFRSLISEAFAGEQNDSHSPAVAPADHWQAESRLRAYGSMTYAGFKSYLYAGLSKDDPRVRAARQWIAQNYTVDENPNVGTDGQYYYYVVFAKAMHAFGEPTVPVPSGSRDWRVDLINKLAELQTADGSFRPVDDRWMENDPVLITAYTMNALQHARQSLQSEK